MQGRQVGWFARLGHRHKATRARLQEPQAFARNQVLDRRWHCGAGPDVCDVLVC